jgi:hypothetical protein
MKGYIVKGILASAHRTGSHLGTHALYSPSGNSNQQGRTKSPPRMSANCAKGKHGSCSMVNCICDCGFHKGAK